MRKTLIKSTPARNLGRLRLSVTRLIVVLAMVAFGPAQADPGASPATPFGFESVEQRAQELLTQDFSSSSAGLPEALLQLSYDQYRDIRYKPSKSLWQDEGLPFRLQFFHRGFLYRDRVAINTVTNGKASPVNYSSDLFDYGANKFSEVFPPDMGFAGMRILHPLRKDDHFDEIAVFLGASYFRAVGAGQAWGISARGLALDTGLAKAEEFPIFREFWIEQPAKDHQHLTVYALMDSPNAVGAFRFIFRPGLALVIEVKSKILLRNPVERLGIAPLTSMYLHGDNTDRFFDDFRPEVHDSDGLLIATRNGEWVWRPLNNPKRLRVSSFQANDLVGFGLSQRDRDYEHYLDLESNFQIRPSTWIETLGNWGPGVVQLIEIPSDAEKYDNIVAFFVPEKPTAAGQTWNFEYKLHFALEEPIAPTLGRALTTRIGAGGTDSKNQKQRKFVVDFGGHKLQALSPGAPVTADLSVSSGQLTGQIVHKNLLNGGWRLAFEYEPEAGKEPAEFRGVLRMGNEILTETWIYQWNSP